MSTELWLVVIQALTQYGPGLVSQLINLGKQTDAPTLEQLTALSNMVKKSESYFEVKV